jgi:hypothetical protein
MLRAPGLLSGHNYVESHQFLRESTHTLRSPRRQCKVAKLLRRASDTIILWGVQLRASRVPDTIGDFVQFRWSTIEETSWT